MLSLTVIFEKSDSYSSDTRIPVLVVNLKVCINSCMLLCIWGLCAALIG